MKTSRFRLLAVFAVLSATACSSQIAGHAAVSVPSPTSSARSAGPTQGMRPTSLAGLLNDVAMRRGEGPGVVRIAVIPGGELVVGQVTLDACEAHYPSEQLRIARHQIVGLNSAGRSIIGNENVVYNNAAGATGALRELRQAIATCPPNEFVPSVIANQPPVRSHFTPMSVNSTTGLLPDHVAVRADVQIEGGKSSTYYAVYQRRGRVLVVVYGPEPTPTLHEALVIAHRLEAEPVALVTG